MAQFVNVGNESFKMAVADRYVDNLMLISHVNSTIATQGRFSYVTRCRRFGKSMAAAMLCAYYDKETKSHTCKIETITA